MKKGILLLIVFLISSLGYLNTAEAVPLDSQEGYAYGFDWSGDKYIQTHDVNETWTDDPEQLNWWQNGSLTFCWDYDIAQGPSNRIESAELYLSSNGNNTLRLDWLVDSVDDVSLFLWNFNTSEWDVFRYENNCPKDVWIVHDILITQDHDNGSVFVRWELAMNFTGNTGHWIPALYIDFVKLIMTSEPAHIETVSEGGGQVRENGPVLDTNEMAIDIVPIGVISFFVVAIVVFIFRRPIGE